MATKKPLTWNDQFIVLLRKRNKLDRQLCEYMSPDRRSNLSLQLVQADAAIEAHREIQPTPKATRIIGGR